MAFSRHGGFFASLQRVEDRLALEQHQELSSDTMTASPLVLLDDPATAGNGSGSGPALDFLTLTSRQDEESPPMTDDDDIARLMALLGLSPPRDAHGGGCDCSGADGFLGKVVGVVGPKCEREKSRLDAWIQHYHRRPRPRREPARLAHLLLAAKASSCRAFPATVNDFLDRDAPPPCTEH